MTYVVPDNYATSFQLHAASSPIVAVVERHAENGSGRAIVIRCDDVDAMTLTRFLVAKFPLK